MVFYTEDDYILEELDTFVDDVPVTYDIVLSLFKMFGKNVIMDKVLNEDLLSEILTQIEETSSRQFYIIFNNKVVTCKDNDCNIYDITYKCQFLGKDFDEISGIILDIYDIDREDDVISVIKKSNDVINLIDNVEIRIKRS